MAANELFLKQLKFCETASNSQPPDYMQSALITELWELDNSQLTIWDTGSGDLEILFCNGCGPVTTYGDMELGQHWLR